MVPRYYFAFVLQLCLPERVTSRRIPRHGPGIRFLIPSHLLPSFPLCLSHRPRLLMLILHPRILHMHILRPITLHRRSLRQLTLNRRTFRSLFLRPLIYGICDRRMFPRDISLALVPVPFPFQ